LNKHIYITIVNWQGWEDTLACVQSIQKLDYVGNVSIIVCDNASQNDSWQQLFNWAQQNYLSSPINIAFKTPVTTSHTFHTPFTKTPITDFTLIRTTHNLGFAGGHNAALYYVLEDTASEYVWLLNNDTVVDANALTTLVDSATQHPRIALWGSTVLEYDQPHIVQCAGGCRYFPGLTLFQNVYGGLPLNQVLQFNASPKLDYVYGASMFLSTKALRQVGFLNEEYFLFYEELDYTQRLRRHGYAIGWCKASRVYHKGSQSVGNRKEGNSAKLSRANYYENLSTLKYTLNFHPFLLPLVIPLRLILKTVMLLKRREYYLLNSLWQAYRDFFHHLLK
jgi:GT2 family glycosyltransferase